MVNDIVLECIFNILRFGVFRCYFLWDKDFWTWGFKRLGLRDDFSALTSVSPFDVIIAYATLIHVYFILEMCLRSRRRFFFLWFNCNQRLRRFSDLHLSEKIHLVERNTKKLKNSFLDWVFWIKFQVRFCLTNIKKYLRHFLSDFSKPR